MLREWSLVSEHSASGGTRIASCCVSNMALACTSINSPFRSTDVNFEGPRKQPVGDLASVRGVSAAVHSECAHRLILGKDARGKVVLVLRFRHCMCYRAASLVVADRRVQARRVTKCERFESVATRQSGRSDSSPKAAI